MNCHVSKNGTIFHNNDDLSGDVIVIRDGQEFLVSGADILEFVAYAYILPKRIASAEALSWRELLDGVQVPVP